MSGGRARAAQDEVGFWVVLLAGGSGSRFGGPEAKQWLSLEGVPLMLHSFRTLRSHPAHRGTVLVLAQGERARFQAALSAKDWDQGPLAFADPGATRALSVASGLEGIPDENPWVMIHDAARPFLPEVVVERLWEARWDADCVLPGLPLDDTVKELDPQGLVEKTPDRSRLSRVQTPQLSRRGTYLRGLAQGSKEPVTDDAQLVESLGLRVRVVPGDELNRKVTRPLDLAILEYLRGGR